jgi:hypothetical protein
VANTPVTRLQALAVMLVTLLISAARLTHYVVAMCVADVLHATAAGTQAVAPWPPMMQPIAFTARCSQQSEQQPAVRRLAAAVAVK